MLPAMSKYNECLSQVLATLYEFCGNFAELHSMTLADREVDWRGARIFNQVRAHFVAIQSSSVAVLGLFAHGQRELKAMKASAEEPCYRDQLAVQLSTTHKDQADGHMSQEVLHPLCPQHL